MIKIIITQKKEKRKKEMRTRPEETCSESPQGGVFLSLGGENSQIIYLFFLLLELQALVYMVSLEKFFV